MADASPDEVRVRVTVDSDTPDLLKRLAGSRRQAREIVHLMRLGLQMEMMLNGKVPMVGISSEGSVLVSNPVPVLASQVSAPVIGKSSPADIPLGGDFAEMTGLDADYFAGAPTAYFD
ncbi:MULTISPECIES: hypothetical protein [Polaromonas]|uniref:Uncharacterized protein n=1 Tax=Polaromonas aquatica TaxID=332657 RepID=A0ABW1TZC2_9BURK